MRSRLFSGLAFAGVAAALAAGIATAAGPTPGFADAGVLSPSGHVRYSAYVHGSTTDVQAARALGGRVLRSATLRGAYGVPLVAYDGTAGGLTRDGKLLVLETGPGNTRTRFVVLDAATLKVRQSFSFPGTWAYDALSPEGNTLYVTQILSSTATFRYLVRAYDLQLHQLVKGAIADKSEPGAMTGMPVSRVASADGTWAYTLYQRLNGGKPFIHALNTRARVAICIDLDWRGNPNNMGDVRLTLSADGQQLVVRRFSDGKAMLTVAAPS